MTIEKPHNIAERFMQMLFITRHYFFRQIKLPMPINNFCVLFLLCEEGPYTCTELSQLLLICKQQLTPIINKMARDGIISKSVLTGDRRSILLQPTAKGQALFDAHNLENLQFFTQHLSKLSKTERAATDASLQQVNQVMEKMFVPPEVLQTAANDKIPYINPISASQAAAPPPSDPEKQPE
jgi:DNA-binding MarR family transcriptional regulator